ncbi:alpha-tocopherol transfer protein-like isoform X2 [Phymastichus coffea]|uniref:alpha-tocopherol transfer protein-like isoform X2 n=1 Tax=Phymastichus coffea TaxID=108790 RepID=UPI00273C8967|nr:alpha-tocopherol transfer protein-like isoform X2 [Phymastichus coffea]
MLAYVSAFTKSAQEKQLDGKDASERLSKSSSDDCKRSDSGCCEEDDNMPEPKELRPTLQHEDDDDEKTRGTRRPDEIVTLELDHIPDNVLEYARHELGESEEVKCQTIHELREMIFERGECMPHRMDDEFLLRFLRARNFNVNRAHRLIVRYYAFKDEHPEIHVNVNPLEMRHIGDDDVMTVPAYRAPCGRRLMIYRIGNWDPRKYSVDEIFKATVLILELGLLEPMAQILGGIVIFDFEGISMAHAWTITPQVASMVFALIVTAFPITTHAIHILNQSWIFDTMFAVFKPLIDSKMNSKIFFHGSDMESLHRHLPPDYLPKKYGGTRDELPYYRWIDALGKDRRVVKEMKGLGYIIPDEFCAKDDADD